MPSTQPKPKRWRPRWSIRTLLVVVTLVCGYFACWGPTKTQGVEDVELWRYMEEREVTPRPVFYDIPEAVLPLVVAVDETEVVPQPYMVMDHRGMKIAMRYDNRRRYYFWFFGNVAKLPYERRLD